MKLVQRTSPRELLTSWIEQVPDDWLALLVPVLIRIVAVVRGFFATAGHAAGRVAVGVPAGSTAVGDRSVDHATIAQSPGAR